MRVVPEGSSHGRHDLPPLLCHHWRGRRDPRDLQPQSDPGTAILVARRPPRRPRRPFGPPAASPEPRRSPRISLGSRQTFPAGRESGPAEPRGAPGGPGVALQREVNTPPSERCQVHYRRRGAAGQWQWRAPMYSKFVRAPTVYPVAASGASRRVWRGWRGGNTCAMLAALLLSRPRRGGGG